MITQFLQEEDGATAIEYGLIAALVAIVIIAALTFLGNALDNIFSVVAETVDSAGDGGGGGEG